MREKLLKYIRRHKIKIIIGTVLFSAWYFSLSFPLFEVPTATVVTSRSGELLGARIADDQQWRFPQMDSVPYRFEKCILLFEDEYFYSHPGFNPFAITKAFVNNLKGHPRRGASTITQQVIRLSRKDKKRNYLEKLIEVAQATRLEVKYSKKEILNLYATHAPFGGNVVGLETASWRYFGIPSTELTWGQAAALAVLPNAPSLIFPGKNEMLLKEKRDKLLYKLYQKNVIDEITYELAKAENLPDKPHPLPDIAPHFTEKIRSENPGEYVVSTLDFHLQNQVNKIVLEHYFQLRQNHIHNLSVLVLDIETREVLAYVGNSPTTSEYKNHVDIIQRYRSTGSILKPFLYTSILHSGELLPNALVSDIPTSINGYVPQNFNKSFQGAVPASTALARSLNIPAVRMLRDYGIQRFYNALEKTNQKGIDKPANHYGLSFILGGAESSLWDVTKAYAGLAGTLNFIQKSASEYRENEFTEPVYILNKKANFGKIQSQPPIWDAGSVYTTLETMKDVNRPEGEESWQFFNDSQPIAWKTGTSYGFKDAWAVGVTSKYVIGVWAGNATGEGRPGLTGILAAAPVLFDVLKSLPKSAWFVPPYDELKEVSVCSKSGFLSGIYCEKSEMQWIPKSGEQSATCMYHFPIVLDKTEQYQVNSSCYPIPDMKHKNWFVLPPMMEHYYAGNHPEYKILPPFAANCYSEAKNHMDFIFPKENEIVIIPTNFHEFKNEIILKLAHRQPETNVYWYLDNEFIGMTTNFHELSFLPVPGKYTLLVIDDFGNELKRRVEFRTLTKQ